MTSKKYPQNPVLMVDDETIYLESCSMVLRSSGINNVITCHESKKVLSLLEKHNFGLIMLDINMPDISGREILEHAVEEFPGIPVIMMTGINEIEVAVECMKMGAFDYLVKPVEGSRLVSSIKLALEIRELRQENSVLKQYLLTDNLEHSEAFSVIVTKNRSMHHVFKYIESIAITPRPVLITGETGVGKELIARVIHNLSGCKGSFVAVNAGGLDDTIFSDTLFGHKKGAFTGADESRAGLIEKASGGTLFLDEIGDLEPASQIKLLRLLQEKEYYTLGLDTPKISDARIIACTNRDLKTLQEDGKFRKDLFYRVSTHQINIPPLRDRMEDLHLLADYFLQKASDVLRKKKPVYPRELITLLSTYDFPGNIRELESMTFDAVSRHQRGILSLNSFRQYIGKERKSTKVISKKETILNANDISMLIPQSGMFPTLKDAESYLIEEAMKRADHNQTTAAQMLGLTRSALNKRLNRGG